MRNPRCENVQSEEIVGIKFKICTLVAYICGFG